MRNQELVEWSVFSKGRNRAVGGQLRARERARPPSRLRNRRVMGPDGRFVSTSENGNASRTCSVKCMAFKFG